VQEQTDKPRLSRIKYGDITLRDRMNADNDGYNVRRGLEEVATAIRMLAIAMLFAAYIAGVLSN